MRMDPRLTMPSRTEWLVVFLIALGIRIANQLWVLTADIDLLEADSSVYWNAATALMQTGQILDGGAPDGGRALTERMPGYIFYLAAMRELFGESFLYVLVPQAFKFVIATPLNELDTS